jgi:7,8-dihydroneopterin aldolase/epimerase/oxygenase
MNLPGFPLLTVETDSLRRIFLKNLRVDASIGIHLKEMMRKQPVLINIDLYVDARAGPRADDIAAVLDYDFLREEIQKIAAMRHFHLQETLCEEIMRICFSKPDVLAARVATEKPEAYPDCESVGCEIFRRRDAAGP